MNVAILGTGNIAGSMSVALNGLGEQVCCYAVASRTLQKAQAFAERWNFAKAYGSYEELANDPAVDLVYVATPHSEHYENAKLCIQHGKNVLVEKAFTANRKQAEELVRLARENKVLLAEAIWIRYMPSRRMVEDILARGDIGTPTYLEANFSAPIAHVGRLHSPALAGGALLDLGMYALTFAAMFFGTDVTAVREECQKYETGVDATDRIVLTYRDGKMADLRTSMVTGFVNYGKIVGTKGYLIAWELNNFNKIEVYDVDGVLQNTYYPPAQINGYEYEVLACKQALQASKLECDDMPLEETLRLMGWMDALRRRWGIVYPFESEQDLAADDRAVWGGDNVWETESCWNREGDHSVLEVYDTETGARTVLAEFDRVIEAPNWSPDGKTLYYNSNGGMYRYNLDTGAEERIDTGFADDCNNDHVLSPDGTRLAVSHVTREDGRSRIYTLPIEGGTPQLVTPLAPSYLHGWSPDGALAYCAERGGEYDIYTIPANGGVERRLTHAPGLNDGSEYDRTGEYIWFNSVRTGLMQAWRMRADGSEQTQMTFDEDWNTWFPHISPDGKQVVMVSYHKGDLLPGEHVPNKQVALRLMNADGSDLRTVVELFGGQGTINVNSWSPDSKKFAFVSYRKGKRS